MKTLYGMSIFALGAGLGLFGWSRLAPNPEADAYSRLQVGTALLSEGEWGEATRELRLALAGTDDKVRLVANHNLGLGLLRLALEGEGWQARDWALEAIGHQERALALRPGLRTAAWNLELAHRRLSELEREREAAGEDQAQRLLASFRLQEEENLPEVLRDRLRETGSGSSLTNRRGPPW